MNEQHSVLSRKDIEAYLYRELKEIYWKFPGKIVPSTTFRELEKHDDPELIAADLLMNIEEDLDVYLPDDAVEALDDKDVCVGVLINTVAKYSPTAEEATPLVEEISSNPRSVAERVVRWFIERFYSQESEMFDKVRDVVYQAHNQRPSNEHVPFHGMSQAWMPFSSGGKDVPHSARLLSATLDIFDGLEANTDILAEIKARQKELVSLVRERGVKRKEARQFVEHLISLLETM